MSIHSPRAEEAFCKDGAAKIRTKDDKGQKHGLRELTVEGDKGIEDEGDGFGN